MANGKPGHILLPPPKGVSSKLLPLKSISDPKNLSVTRIFPQLQPFVNEALEYGQQLPEVTIGTPSDALRVNHL
ncbi:hypothetical protein CR513_62240, partial [Mucuna pruriens]